MGVALLIELLFRHIFNILHTHTHILVTSLPVALILSQQVLLTLFSLLFFLTNSIHYSQ